MQKVFLLGWWCGLRLCYSKLYIKTIEVSPFSYKQVCRSCGIWFLFYMHITDIQIVMSSWACFVRVYNY